MVRDIELNEKVSSLYLYREFLKKLSEYYKDVFSVTHEIPIFNLCKVKFIEPEALPVLLSIGAYLAEFHKHAIDMRINNDSKVTNVLLQTNFINYASKYKIFDFTPDVTQCTVIKELRELHKVTMTLTMDEYEDVTSIKDEIEKRAYVKDNLKINDRVTYQKILEDTNRLSEDIIDLTLDTIAEIKSNSIIHSKSKSFTYVASNRYGTYVSLADCGIGFEQSFIDKGVNLEFIDTEYDGKKARVRDFYVIMSVINYSYKKHCEDGREDLWTLIRSIVQSNGSVKIHYGNVQVIFTTARCRRCTEYVLQQKSVLKCVKCMMRDFTDDDYSPVKIFDVKYSGVHIEFIINR